MVLDAKFRMRSPDRDLHINHARLAVVGSKSVGKTALTVRYLTKRFIGEYQSNTDMMYRTTIPLDGTNVSLELLDLSSNLDEVVVPRETVAWAEAWLVIYSITSLESFQVAVKAVEAVTATWGGDTPNPPVLILGNKKDLEHARQVPKNEGKRLADRHDCHFAEVSAAEMDSQINDSIDGLLRILSQTKSHTSTRLRKLSVSKMFNQLMSRSNVGNNGNGSNITCSSSSQDRTILPRVSIRDRGRKRIYHKQS